MYFYLLVKYGAWFRPDLEPIPVLIRQRYSDECEAHARRVKGIEEEIDMYMEAEGISNHYREDWTEDNIEAMKGLAEDLEFAEKEYKEAMTEYEQDVLEDYLKRNLPLEISDLHHLEQLAGLGNRCLALRIKPLIHHQLEDLLSHLEVKGAELITFQQISSWENSIHDRGAEWLIELENQHFNIR